MSDAGPQRNIGDDVARDGALLRVAVLGARLPNRCIVCNGPGEGPRFQQFLNRFSTAGPLWTTLIVVFASWLALFWLRPVIVEFSLCSEHRRWRRRRIVLCASGSASCFALGWGAFVWDLPKVGLVAFGACAAFGFLAHRLADVIRLRERTEKYAWLKVPAPFLEGIGRDA